MSEWVEKQFKNFIKLNRGFDLPNDKMVEGKYPVIASTNIKGYHNQYKITPPCVVTGRSGSLGTVQYIENKCIPLNTTLYVKDFKGNFPKFVFYFLKTMHLEIFNSGAGVPTLNQNHLHSIKLIVPPIPTQARIAEILSTYDDAIENNNRRIELLEKSAQELYREWFVRFRFPGYKKAKFVNGLPEGWEVKRLGHIADFGNGKSRPSSTEGKIPVYGGNGILAYCNKSNYVNGIIIGRVGAYCGSVYYEKNPHWVSDNAIAVKNKENCTLEFIYFLLSHLNLNQRQIGTGQPLLTQELLSKIKVILPPYRLQQEFSNFAEQVNVMVKILLSQSQNLTRQRDLLLPRLMSGKLEV